MHVLHSRYRDGAAECCTSSCGAVVMHGSNCSWLMTEKSSARCIDFVLRPGGLLAYKFINNLPHFTQVLNIVTSFTPVPRISECLHIYFIVIHVYTPRTILNFNIHENIIVSP